MLAIRGGRLARQLSILRSSRAYHSSRAFGLKKMDVDAAPAKTRSAPDSDADGERAGKRARIDGEPSLDTQNAVPEATTSTATSSVPDSGTSNLKKNGKPKGDKPAHMVKKLSSRARKAAARGSRAHAMPDESTMDAVLFKEVEDVLGAEAVAKAVEDGVEWEAPYPKAKEEKAEVEIRIVGISASGCGIGLPVESESEENERRKHWAIVVPFALPGERVRARVFRHARLHSHADFVEMLEPNPELRDDSRVQCKYFGKCGGCQYQMVDYAQQLEWKADVVRNAYRRFSGLPSDAVPPVQTTIGSPLQYGYRTKITPHFDAPPKSVAKKYAGSDLTAPEGDKPDWLRIGFNQVNTRHVLDIEECPIAAPVLNQALPSIREGIAKKSLTYKKGVSLILRDSLTIPAPAVEKGDAPVPAPTSEDDGPHVCITDFKATVRERVGPLLFDYNAGSFFQNNNSVLVPLTSYVRDAIFPPSSSAATSAPAPTHLVDAYCGAGLFALSLAEKFEKVAGIELSADSIRSATHNATLNGLQDKCTFRAGDATSIFASVPEFPPHLTALVIDPPRKGCDESFINQMLAFGAGTVVYVSCNVHTQARDVGRILEGRVKRKEGEGEGKYVMESLRGFDLFPQTAHVEAVTVLRLVDA